MEQNSSDVTAAIFPVGSRFLSRNFGSLNIRGQLQPCNVKQAQTSAERGFGSIPSIKFRRWNIFMGMFLASKASQSDLQNSAAEHVAAYLKLSPECQMTRRPHSLCLLIPEKISGRCRPLKELPPADNFTVFPPILTD